MKKTKVSILFEDFGGVVSYPFLILMCVNSNRLSPAHSTIHVPSLMYNYPYFQAHSELMSLVVKGD